MIIRSHIARYARYVLIAALFLCPCFSHAQANYDYNWLSGFWYIDQDSNRVTGNLVSFRSGKPEYTFFEKPITQAEGTISVSDKDGNLLFYSNGCKVYSFDLEKGLLVRDNPFYTNQQTNLLCNIYDRGTIFPDQGQLVLPGTIENSFYILYTEFHTHPVWLIHVKRLSQTLIEAQNKHSITVHEQGVLFEHDSLASRLSATKSQDGQAWWILSWIHTTNRYYSVKWQDGQILAMLQDSIGERVPELHRDGWGQYNFSPDGSKYVKYITGQGAFLYDFDRATGKLSNFRKITIDDPETYLLNTNSGAIFSPDSRLLYLSQGHKIWQYDLMDTDLQNSGILVAENTDLGPYNPRNMGTFRFEHGPDCKIYSITKLGIEYYNVIHNPNVRGLGCNYEQGGVKLDYPDGRSNYNWPNYRLGTPWENWCDSLSLTVDQWPDKQQLTIQPNPAADYLRISLRYPAGTDLQVAMLDIYGRQVMQGILQNQDRFLEFSTQQLPPGIYFCTLWMDGRLLETRKVLIAR